ncbi:MAG: GGDEF domain-containing protein, partial [Betaproteobacteria bacterium]|nr:GGDEF domain-containing protein [Betaproteobacteria bacterium]
MPKAARLWSEWQERVRSWPLARKILVINAIGALATWALVIAVILVDQYALARRELLQEVQRLADGAARQFEQSSATLRSTKSLEVVNTLRAQQDVQGAAVYDGRGELLMGTSTALALPLALADVPEPSANPASDALLAVRALSDLEPQRGTLVVWLDPGTMHRRVLEAAYPFMAIAGAGVLCVVLLVWLALPVTLRRLGRLRQVVGDVTSEGNYAARAQIAGGDEVGQLAQAFNTMLDQIQARDATLRTELEERQRAQKQSAYLASHDAATGLPNRRFFGDALNDALSHANKSGIAVMLVGIDNFKRVNDSLGHRAGDQLLSEIGTRMRNQIGAQGLVCRVGGDEFAAILEAVTDEAQADELGKQLLHALSRPVWIDGTELSPGAS